MGGEVTLATTVVVATFVALLRKIDILYIVPAGAVLSLLLLLKTLP